MAANIVGFARVSGPTQLVLRRADKAASTTMEPAVMMAVEPVPATEPQREARMTVRVVGSVAIRVRRVAINSTPAPDRPAATEMAMPPASTRPPTTAPMVPMNLRYGGLFRGNR